MSTLRFARNKIVGVEQPDASTYLVHGVLEDTIYALDIDLEVRSPGLEITSIEGKYRRYTTTECPKSIPKLQNAVGLSIADKEFARKVRRVVGREGCTHFANLLIECCDGVMQAAAYGDWKKLKESGQAPERDAYLAEKFQTMPGLKGSCLAYSGRGG